MEVEVVEIAGLGKEAAAHDRKAGRQGRCLYPGFLELDFDFTVFAGERECHVTEETCVDIRIQVDLQLARREAGFARADLAGRLEARDLFPATAHVGKAAVEHGADGWVEGIG
jgi:hypothetical protein